MKLLQAAVQYRPAYDAAVMLVNGLAPDLVAEVRAVRSLASAKTHVRKASCDCKTCMRGCVPYLGAGTARMRAH